MKSWKMSFTATAIYDELEFTEEEVEEYIYDRAPELGNLPFEEKVIAYVKRRFHYTDISFNSAISELLEYMYWDSCPSYNMYDFEVDSFEEESDEEEDEE